MMIQVNIMPFLVLTSKNVDNDCILDFNNKKWILNSLVFDAFLSKYVKKFQEHIVKAR